MPKRHYSSVHSLNQKIASTRAGSWFYARTLHHLDRVAVRLTGGRTTATSIVSGLPVVMLTTIGARSGQPRTLPLLCIRLERDANRFALVASNWGQAQNPSWYYNLKAHPQATCVIDGVKGEYVAHEASGEE